MKRKVHIYGGGPSSLMLAHQLLGIPEVEIHIFEKTKRIGSKFLVAGKGGFNLSHEMEIEKLIGQYKPAGFMDACLNEFPPAALREWLNSLNIPTYVGSSNRIFPRKEIKPIQVLNSILAPLLQDITFHYDVKVVGIHQDYVKIQSGEGEVLLTRADYHVFGLGGASWPKTGSDGSWKDLFQNLGIEVNDFGPSNCGLKIGWDEAFSQKYSGVPLKNISIQFQEQVILGEALITDYGIEGNAIYPIASAVAKSLASEKATKVLLDLKPQVSIDKLLSKFSKTKGNTSSKLRQIGLSRVAIAILKPIFSKEDWTLGVPVVQLIKNVTLDIIELTTIEESISTTGGIALNEVDENFQLLKKRGYYAIGEMLDWDTITGGFLLQACFSMGFRAGQSIRNKLLDPTQ